jgi:hypothetical protein
MILTSGLDGERFMEESIDSFSGSRGGQLVIVEDCRCCQKTTGEKGVSSKNGFVGSRIRD